MDSPATQTLFCALAIVPEAQAEHSALAPPAEKVLPVQLVHVPFDRPWPAVQPADSKGRAGRLRLWHDGCLGSPRMDSVNSVASAAGLL
jgi:hypothetical protein